MINRITSKRKRKTFQEFTYFRPLQNQKNSNMNQKTSTLQSIRFSKHANIGWEKNNKNTKQKKHRLKIDNCGAPCHGVAGRSRICASLSQVDQREKLQSMDPSPRPDAPGTQVNCRAFFFRRDKKVNLGHQNKRSFASCV